MRSFWARYGARTVVACLLVSLGVLFGCGGSAGVQDGTVVGRVFSDASSISGSRSPLAGVTVVARRQAEANLVVRRSLSDANGQYVFTDLPNGAYFIGYSKEGFIPVDALVGATGTRTVQAAQDIFVESNSTVQVPDVTLQTNRQTGTGIVIITVLDAISGDPVVAATLTAGVVATSNGGNNGVYSLAVPLQPTDESTRNGLFDSSFKFVDVQADGYNSANFSVGVIANETVRRTVFLTPLTVSFDGIIRVSSFPNLFNLANLGDFQVNLNNTTVALSSIGGSANGGIFRILGVPASNAQLTRTFNIRFTHPDLQTVVLSNVVAPRAGDRTIPLVVTMTPTTVDVVGTAVDSGNFPTNGTAVVVETGQSGAVVNGSYTIAGVPTRHASGGTPNTFTVEIRTFNNAGGAESAQATFRPSSDGSANPIFIIPRVKTN